MSDNPTVVASGYSVNYKDLMQTEAEIHFNRECFDAPWEVTVQNIDAPNGAQPSAVCVKVLQSTDESGTGTSTYDGYDVIAQQSASHGSTCTLVQQADGSYVATGACPVWKCQPVQTGESRQPYSYRILVTGYIADGRFYSLENVISSKEKAMTYTGNDEDPASCEMEVTIPGISVPSVEFDPNGGTLRNGCIVVENNGAVTAGQISTRIPTWEGHTFDAWYTEAEGGARQTTGITNITGKRTLYAHWKMVVDPVGNAPTANDLTYNGEAQALVTKPGELPAGCEKIEYSLDGVDWTDDLPSAFDAGAYTVKVRYVGDGAHAYADGADVQATVRPKPITADDVDFNGPADFAYVYDTQATGDAMLSTKPHCKYSAGPPSERPPYTANAPQPPSPCKGALRFRACAAPASPAAQKPSPMGKVPRRGG